jgi:hypothetical protein
VTSDALAAVAADFDNDGDEDLFVCRHNAADDCFRNEGNGAFTRLTQAQFGKPVADGTVSFDAAWVDYDRDGFLDLFVVNGYPVTENDCLYRNNGSGLFIKMTAGQVGPIVNDRATTYASSWADYDNDRYPDAWVERWTGSGFLYHNSGLDAPGFLAPVTEGSIPRENSRAAGQWVDYDNDGWLDLFVTGSSEGRTNSLHRNAGGLAFTDVAASAGLALHRHGHEPHRTHLHRHPRTPPPLGRQRRRHRPRRYGAIRVQPVSVRACAPSNSRRLRIYGPG